MLEDILGENFHTVMWIAVIVWIIVGMMLIVDFVLEQVDKWHASKDAIKLEGEYNIESYAVNDELNLVKLIEHRTGFEVEFFSLRNELKNPHQFR